MKTEVDYSWLDKVIEKQRAVNGDVVMKMIQDAAEAEEHIHIDDLEEFARKSRKP